MTSKQEPKAPAKDVADKLDPSYSEADFDRALERVTRRVEDPGRPGQGSTRRATDHPSGDST